MHNFIKTLHTRFDRDVEFYFSRIYTSEGEKYFVSLIDPTTRTHLFYMHSLNGHWKIAERGRVAEWILEVEDQLAAEIERQYNGFKDLQFQ